MGKWFEWCAKGRNLKLVGNRSEKKIRQQVFVLQEGKHVLRVKNRKVEKIEKKRLRNKIGKFSWV